MLDRDSGPTVRLSFVVSVDVDLARVSVDAIANELAGSLFWKEGCGTIKVTRPDTLAQPEVDSTPPIEGASD